MERSVGAVSLVCEVLGVCSAFCCRADHVSCLREAGRADLKRLPKGEWFCSSACRKVGGAFMDYCSMSHGLASLGSSCHCTVHEAASNTGFV